MSLFTELLIPKRSKLTLQRRLRKVPRSPYDNNSDPRFITEIGSTNKGDLLVHPPLHARAQTHTCTNTINHTQRQLTEMSHKIKHTERERTIR